MDEQTKYRDSIGLAVGLLNFVKPPPRKALKKTLTIPDRDNLKGLQYAP
jgi:hypothetical protein